MRIFRLLTLLMLSGILGACAMGPQTQQLQTNWHNLTSKHQIESVPFFPQSDYQCGPAALATVLGFRGQDVSPDELVSQVYIPSRKGSLQVEILAAARSYGMLAYQIQPLLTDLISEIHAGNPVLVMQNLGLSWVPRWHYAVVIGYDGDEGVFILRSGTLAKRLTPFSVFENTWARSEYWGIVITPPDKKPATAKPFPYLQAAHALEKVGQFNAAKKAYKTSTQTWPTEPLTWLSLGNLDYKQQNYPAAEIAYRNSLKQQPTSASAWNNLASTLSKLNCHQIAAKATSCAVSLNPDNRLFRKTYEDIKQLAGMTSTHTCDSVPDCPNPSQSN